jgi:isocitrate/isopropylmalate dehydrogenase
MRYMRLLILSGDGIGPEITAAAMSVLKATDESFQL